MFSFIFAVAFALSSFVSADPVPTSPDSSSVFNEGSTCTIQWTPDTTGLWKVMNIELMTGPNLAMVHLSTVGTVDGTDPTKNSFSYPCLKVTPHAAIYFYQFTSPNSPNVTWTTRFTLAGPHGETVPPPNATQPGSGDPIPWGTGQLVNAADGTPPPVKGGQTSGSTNATSATTSSSSIASATLTNSSSASIPAATSVPSTSTSVNNASSQTSSPAPSSSTGGSVAVVAGTLAFAAPLLSLVSLL